MNTIKINGKEYKVKQTLRAMFMFESITEKAFEIKTMLDTYLYFYCIILANNEENVIEWDEFLNALDNDATIYEQINKILEKEQKIDEVLAGDNDGKDKKKESV